MHEKLSGGTGIYSGGGNQSNSVTIKSGGGKVDIPAPPKVKSDTTHIVVSNAYKASLMNKKLANNHKDPLTTTPYYMFHQKSYDGYSINSYPNLQLSIGAKAPASVDVVIGGLGDVELKRGWHFNSNFILGKTIDTKGKYKIYLYLIAGAEGATTTQVVMYLAPK